MFNVAPLSPVVRPIVLKAAEIYYRHTHPWFIGLLIHGSAYKGGAIPGSSDIDLQLYLESGAFDAYGQLPIDLSAAIQRELSTVDTGPFQYIQTYVSPGMSLPNRPRSWVGPIPDTYHLLRGTLPILEATEADLLTSSHHTLQSISRIIADSSLTLLQHGGTKLQRATRVICCNVWPTLYSVLTLRDGQPFAIWKRPKEDAIALIAENDPMGREIRAFYHCAYQYFGQEHSIEDAVQVIVQGTKFLQTAEQWYQHNFADLAAQETS